MDEQVFFTPDEHKQLIALYKDYCNYQETLCKKRLLQSEKTFG